MITQTFLGAKFKGDTGQYRISPEMEKQLLDSDKSPRDFFQERFDSDYGQANELAKYLDGVAYQTQGQFFQTDLFGNPTPYSKYVDRQGNIKPDALEIGNNLVIKIKGEFLVCLIAKKIKVPNQIQETSLLFLGVSIL